MFRRTFTVATVVLGLFWGWQASALAQAQEEEQEPAASTGIVVSVAGDVIVDRAGGRQPAVEGFVLEDGDVVVMRADGRCTGFTPAGEPLRLDGRQPLIPEYHG